MLGFNTQLPYTIGNFGCKLTCFAMYAKALGKNETPLTLNDKFRTTGQFTGGGNLNDDNCFHVVFGDVNMKYASPKYDDLVPDSLLTKMKQLLDGGFVLFAEIDFNPSTVVEDMHFVLINGYDDQNWYVVDPWTGTQITLGVYGDVKRVLYRVWAYDLPLQKEAQEICIDGKLYEHLVNGASVRKDVATYLEISDPDNTPFDKIQSVIVGYKSLVTDSQNKANEANTKLAIANTEIVNLKDKIANMTSECQKSYSLLEAEYKALIEKSKTDEKLKGEYQGMIDEYAGKVRELEKAGGQKDLQITALTSKVEVLTKNQAKSYKLGELLGLIWEKIKVFDIKL